MDIDEFLKTDTWPLNFIQSSKCEQLLNTIPEAVIISDEQAQILQVNPKASMLLGYSREELLKLKVTSLFPEGLQEQHASLRQMFFRRVNKGEDLPNEYNQLAICRKGGELFSVAAALTHLASDQGLLVIDFLRDLSAEQAQAASLSHHAYHDPLTELPNRAYLTETLQRTLARVKRYEDHAALLFIDLDNFKPVNDTYGHAYGDELLKAVGQRLQSTVREEDFVARLGGDEFAVILYPLHEQEPKDSARIVAERILKICAETFTIHEQAVHIYASIGIAYINADFSDPDQILIAADRAMYQAKEQGGNCFKEA